MAKREKGEQRDVGSMAAAKPMHAKTSNGSHKDTVAMHSPPRGKGVAKGGQAINAQEPTAKERSGKSIGKSRKGVEGNEKT